MASSANSILHAIIQNSTEQYNRVLSIENLPTSYARRIYPDLTPSALTETEDMYNQGDNKYYKFSTEFIKDLIYNEKEVISEREYDQYSVYAFIANTYAHKIDKGPINIIDFGGNIGTLFYSTVSRIGSLIKSWEVIELSGICNQGEVMKSQLLQSGVDINTLNKLSFSEKLSESKNKDESYAVICNGVLMHLEDPRLILNNIARTKPDAIMLGNSFEVDQLFFDNCFTISNSARDKDFMIVRSGPRDGIKQEHFYCLYRIGYGHDLMVSTLEQLDINIVSHRNFTRSKGSLRFSYIFTSEGELKFFPSLDVNTNSIFLLEN